MSNIFRSFCEAAASSGDTGAPPTPAGETAFATLASRSAQFAAVLRERGARPGDRVLAVIDKSVDAVALYLACLRSGLVFLPTNPGATGHELGHLLGDARPRLVVCRPALEAPLRALPAAAQGPAPLTLGTDGEGSLADLAAAAAPHEAVLDCDDDAPAALLYTSGTTGAPKGVPLSHGNLASNAAALVRSWAFTRDDVLIHALPVFHVHGLFVALHCALLSGCRLRLLPRFDADAVRRALPGATVLMGVPTYYARLLALPDFGRADCAGMRLFVSGSAPLSASLFGQFEARTGHRILERYGMTETGMLTSNPLHGERVPGTVGFALPGVEVRVRTAHGQAAATGAPGMVEVRGPGVFAGYLNRPQADAEAFTADGWFRTGDLGSLDGEGRLTLVGRARDVVISGGLNVYPAEVEACLDGLACVRESAVVGVPHADLGEAVLAIVVPSDPAHPPDAATLRAAAREHLAGYKCPRGVVVTDELPRNAMGKVRKEALRERHAAHFQRP